MGLDSSKPKLAYRMGGLRIWLDKLPVKGE
jgi:hypothetical protein